MSNLVVNLDATNVVQLCKQLINQLMPLDMVTSKLINLIKLNKQETN